MAQGNRRKQRGLLKLRGASTSTSLPAAGLALHLGLEKAAWERPSGWLAARGKRGSPEFPACEIRHAAVDQAAGGSPFCSFNFSFYLAPPDVA